MTQPLILYLAFSSGLLRLILVYVTAHTESLVVRVAMTFRPTAMVSVTLVEGRRARPLI